MAQLTGYNTHVANATRGKILAKVAEDKIVVKMHEGGGNANIGYGGFSIGGGGNSRTEYFIAALMKDGFVTIGSGEALPFPANAPYVTVYTESGKMVCENYRPGGDYSVIVTAQETIQRTKYGSVWVDISGRRHR